MLKVADDAKKHLKKALHAYTDDPEIGLRLLVGAPGKIRLRLDKERSGDQVVEYEGFKVLLVGQEVAQALAETTLDTIDTPQGTELAISKYKDDQNK